MSLVKVRLSHYKSTKALVDAWQVSETSQSQNTLGNIQYQYLPELLVNIYSYHLIVLEKCVLLLCVKKLGFLRFSHIILNTFNVIY